LNYIVKNEDAVVKHWMRAGARGWRLDLADELPGEFLRVLREEVKGQDNDAIIIGEVWEDASNKVSYGVQREYLLGAELDGVLNYPFKNAIFAFLKGEISSYDFNAQVISIIENYPPEALYSSLNILGNHDTARLRTALGDDRLLKLAAVWQMTFMGVPCVYYGDEAGMTGEADPYNRRSFPWGREDLELREHYKNLIKLRKENADLVSGGYEFIPINDDVLGYKRGEVLILLNRSEREQSYNDIKIAPFEGVIYDVKNKIRK
jgi:pullulanase